MKKLIIRIISLCFLLWFLFSCDNESKLEPSRTLRKAKFSSSILLGGKVYSSTIKRALMTIKTINNKGDSVYAKCYNDSPDGKEVNNKLFDIDSIDHSIIILLDVSATGKNYFIEQFDLLDDQDHTIYKMNEEHKKFTLKIGDIHEVTIEMVPNKVMYTGSTIKVSPIISTHSSEFSFSIAFLKPKPIIKPESKPIKIPHGTAEGVTIEDTRDTYFKYPSNIDITLTYGKKSLFDQKNAFSKFKNSNALKITLPGKRSSYGKKFTLNAGLNNPRQGGGTVTHKFTLPENTDRLIEPDKLIVMYIQNNPPEITIKDKSALLTDTAFDAGIIVKDKDNDLCSVNNCKWDLYDQKGNFIKTLIKKTEVINISMIDYRGHSSKPGENFYLELTVTANDGIQEVISGPYTIDLIKK